MYVLVIQIGFSIHLISVAHCCPLMLEDITQMWRGYFEILHYIVLQNACHFYLHIMKGIRLFFMNMIQYYYSPDWLCYNQYLKWILKATLKYMNNNRPPEQEEPQSRESYISYIQGNQNASGGFIYRKWIITTFQNMLMAPKDKLTKEEIFRVRYHMLCSDCSGTYIGETGRAKQKEFQTRNRTSHQ